MGPKWIFQLIYYCLGHFYTILLFVRNHYYFSSLLVVIIFVISVIYPCIKYTTHKEKFNRRDFIELNRKVDNILDILQRIEDKLDEE